MLISKIITLTLIEETMLKSIGDLDDVSCYLFGSYAKGKPTNKGPRRYAQFTFRKRRKRLKIVRRRAKQIKKASKRKKKKQGFGTFNISTDATTPCKGAT